MVLLELLDEIDESKIFDGITLLDKMCKTLCTSDLLMESSKFCFKSLVIFDKLVGDEKEEGGGGEGNEDILSGSKNSLASYFARIHFSFSSRGEFDLGLVNLAGDLLLEKVPS